MAFFKNCMWKKKENPENECDALSLYVVHEGESHGPCSLLEIRTFLAEGSLGLENLAWHEKLPDWVPLSEIPEIFES